MVGKKNKVGVESMWTRLATNDFKRTTYCDTKSTGAAAGAGATYTPAHNRGKNKQDTAVSVWNGVFGDISGRPAMKLILCLPET